MQNKDRVFVSGDWHGCGKVAKQVLDWLKPEDTLYFLGDAIDRAPDGLTIFDELIARPNTIFLKGNHEAMMAQAIPYIAKDLDENDCFWDLDGYYHWFANGGRETAKSFPDMSRARMFKYKKIIDEMPVRARYNSPNGHTVIIEHAGYTPFSILNHRKHDPLWDREHFYDSWNNGWEYQPESEIGTTYLVHGHTPVQYLRFDYGYNEMTPLTKEEVKHKRNWSDCRGLIIPEVIRYCEGHKFCVDMCTIVSRRIALLNLDTFEVIYFDEEED